MRVLAFRKRLFYIQWKGEITSYEKDSKTILYRASYPCNRVEGSSYNIGSCVRDAILDRIQRSVSESLRK